MIERGEQLTHVIARREQVEDALAMKKQYMVYEEGDASVLRGRTGIMAITEDLLQGIKTIEHALQSEDEKGS